MDDASTPPEGEAPDAAPIRESGVSSFLDDAEELARRGDYKAARALLEAQNGQDTDNGRLAMLRSTVGVGSHARHLIIVLTIALAAIAFWLLSA